MWFGQALSQRPAELVQNQRDDAMSATREAESNEITRKGRAALEVIDQYDEAEDFDALVERELSDRVDEP